MNDRDPGFPRGRDEHHDPQESRQAFPWEPGPEDAEETLRRLLRETVSPIEPSPDSLTQLQLAVPARQRRRRQLLVGAVASVVLLGVGMPLTIRTAASVGEGGGDSTAHGDHGEFPVGVNSGGDGGASDGTGSDDSSGQTHDPETEDGGGPGGGSQDDGGTGGETATEGTEPSEEPTESASSVCSREMLGEAETITHEPDDAGQIYGAFRLVNVSDEACLIDGSGEMDVAPLGDATTIGTDVQVVEQTDDVQATALPAPEEAVEQLVLDPGAAYEVMFAYVPEDGSTGGGCVQSGPTDEPTPDPTEPSSGTGEPTSGTDAGGTSEGTGDEPAGEADGGTGGTGGTGGDTGSGSDTGAGGGSAGEVGGETGDDTGGGDSGGGGGGGEDDRDNGVVLVYTPDAGEPPAAEVELPGVCSGTVYRTDALPAETE
ncbi:hypothetical protein [Streptomyces sp. 6N223]|uniref:hypothetical protein n=1 Tax=Streptomyces sp. 6N223 TaxID=3457412 RepID=UPI003FD402AE